MMGRKPVHYLDANSVLNLSSGFAHKLLCTGPTMTAGNSCQYSCSFCYVPQLLARNPQMLQTKQVTGLPHEGMVTRRLNAAEILKQQLLKKNGSRRFHNNEPHTVYCSPLVDCAPNLELARETADMCNLILEHTVWDIRLLSKGNLLSRVAQMCGQEMKKHGIFGFSTGTLNDALAASFEEGTAKVSRRLRDLYKLQDSGYRTYGMICPIIPQRNFTAFAEEMAASIRFEKCEHVWVEVLNARGASLTRTTNALRNGGFDWEADQLELIAGDKEAWEHYARSAFLALQKVIPAEKLRFMQYVTPEHRDWWKQHANSGALLLGAHA